VHTSARILVHPDKVDRGSTAAANNTGVVRVEPIAGGANYEKSYDPALKRRKRYNGLE